MELIDNYGWIDGAHHKQWIIDQIARIVKGDKYDEWVKDGGDWDEGIAP